MSSEQNLFGGIYSPPWLMLPEHKDWQQVATYGQTMHWKPKSNVYDIGALSSEIVLIREGLLCIVALGYNGQERTLGILGPGSILGEVSLFHEVDSSNHMIRVVAPCTGIVFSKKVLLEKIMPHHTSLTLSMCKNMAMKSYIMSTQLECMTFMNGEQKIAYFLYHLSIEQDKSSPFYHSLARLPLGAVGELLGLHRVTTSNIINSFKQLGILAADASYIKVLNREALIDTFYS